MSASNFYLKETLTQVFSREFCELFKNTYFVEDLRTTEIPERESLFNPFITETVIIRNQSIDLQSKSIDWFLYDNDLRLERVNKVASLTPWTHLTVLERNSNTGILLWIL